MLAAVIATVYVIVGPPSLDLAAALFRARLFQEEGFGIWNDFWYAGHSLPGYSVLFPAISAALTPQLAGALAAIATVPAFTALAWRHRGRAGLPGALGFGAFTTIDLFTGRLVFAFGLLPAALGIIALDRRRPVLACLLAAVSALCSPVAALFAAVVAGGYALAALVRAHRPGPALGAMATAAAALGAIVALAVAFPEGGSEPFALGSMLPVLVAALAGAACLRGTTLRACLVAYAVAVLAAFVVASPVGDNVARLGTLLGAPVATVALWGRRPRLLAAALVPLVYLGVQAPVQNVVVSSGSPETSVGFYRPLVAWLKRRPGPPFRIEIPFTALHWEAFRVATHVPLARGWERQLDIADDGLFYRRGALTAGSYEAWLHARAVRYVAVPDAPLDPSGRAEAALVGSGPAYLGAPVSVGEWRVYAVRDATPIATPAAALTALGPDWLELRVRRRGPVLLRVHWSPYWELVRGSGCVSRAGADTRVTLTRGGPARLQTRFALGRIGAGSPRCTHIRRQ